MMRPLIFVFLLLASPAWADVLTGNLNLDTSPDPTSDGHFVLGADPLEIGAPSAGFSNFFGFPDQFRATFGHAVGFSGSITDGGQRYELFNPSSLAPCFVAPCATMTLIVTGLRGTGVVQDGCSFCLPSVRYTYAITASGEVDFPDGHVLPITGQGQATEFFHAGNSLWQGVFTAPVADAMPEPATWILLLTGLVVGTLHQLLTHLERTRPELERPATEL